MAYKLVYFSLGFICGIISTITIFKEYIKFKKACREEIINNN